MRIILGTMKKIIKPTKTISGITPIAVMLPPRKCDHGLCTYCPNLDVPQSYTPKSPVVLRASKLGFDSYKQVKARLKVFREMNHPTDKVEIIIMGGTFLQYPKKFQYDFVKGIYDALNRKKSKSLALAKKLNERSKHRCVALCIETRPDVIDVKRMREFGATRVELGVQIIDDRIYRKVKRGHAVKDVVDATRVLKNAGFKIGYHLMPGLPGSDLKKDLKFFKKIFSSQNFKPDQIKIYPCQVMPCSELEKDYWEGNYKPYGKEEIEKFLFKAFKAVPRYCRVMRVMREIPLEYIVAGTKRIDLRREVEKKLREKKISVKEIRFREIGFVLRDRRELDENLKMKVTKYRASNGEEYFLEIVNSDDVLFGLLRLRIFDSPTARNIESSQSASPDCSLNQKVNAKILTRTDLSQVNRGALVTSKLKREKREKVAIIRELHVYGPSLKIGQKGKFSQHKGFGKWLLDEAEKIAGKKGIGELKVISGVGVREYYKRFGYCLNGEYMVKDINA